MWGVKSEKKHRVVNEVHLPCKILSIISLSTESMNLIGKYV